MGEFAVEKGWLKKGVGLIVIGQVLKGSITQGAFGLHNGKRFTIKSIEENHRALQAAHEGADVGICVEGLEVADIPGGTRLQTH